MFLYSRTSSGKPGMLNTRGFLFNGRDGEPVFHSEVLGMEVVNSLVICAVGGARLHQGPTSHTRGR